MVIIQVIWAVFEEEEVPIVTKLITRLVAADIPVVQDLVMMILVLVVVVPTILVEISIIKVVVMKMTMGR